MSEIFGEGPRLLLLAILVMLIVVAVLMVWSLFERRSRYAAAISPPLPVPLPISVIMIPVASRARCQQGQLVFVDDDGNACSSTKRDARKLGTVKRVSRQRGRRYAEVILG